MFLLLPVWIDAPSALASIELSSPAWVLSTASLLGLLERLEQSMFSFQLCFVILLYRKPPPLPQYVRRWALGFESNALLLNSCKQLVKMYSET
jgi:hypothetical protein